MTQARAGCDAERASLKTAVKRLVVGLGGIEAAASCTRVGKSQIAEYGAVHADDRHMPVDVVLDLERIFGEPLITEALARAAGMLLMPVELPGEGDIVVALQSVATDAGQTLADALRALQTDMRPQDLLALQADLTTLARATSHALAVVNQRVKITRLAVQEARIDDGS